MQLICFAHSGGTDSNGGHYNRYTGEYHYHHGEKAHQHPNNICPYTKNKNDKTTLKDYAIIMIVLFGICYGPRIVYGIFLFLKESLLKLTKVIIPPKKMNKTNEFRPYTIENRKKCPHCNKYLKNTERTDCEICGSPLITVNCKVYKKETENLY